MPIQFSVTNFGNGESNGENFGNWHPPYTASHAASLRARRRLQTARIDVKLRQDVAETVERRSVFSECKKKKARKSTVKFVFLELISKLDTLLACKLTHGIAVLVRTV